MSFLSLADNVFALRFLRLLTTRWENTNAFKRGIIDNKGKVLLKPDEIPDEDKQYYDYFHRLVFNLRRLLQKVPGVGSSIITNYVAALLLIKEEIERLSPDSFVMSEQQFFYLVEHHLLKEGVISQEDFEKLINEDGAAMTTSSSGVSDTAPAKPVFARVHRRIKTFDVDSDTYNKFIHPKQKFKRWSAYTSPDIDENLLKKIKSSVFNKDHFVILRDNATGRCCTVTHSR